VCSFLVQHPILQATSSQKQPTKARTNGSLAWAIQPRQRRRGGHPSTGCCNAHRHTSFRGHHTGGTRAPTGSSRARPRTHAVGGPLVHTVPRSASLRPASDRRHRPVRTASTSLPQRRGAHPPHAWCLGRVTTRTPSLSVPLLSRTPRGDCCLPVFCVFVLPVWRRVQVRAAQRHAAARRRAALPFSSPLWRGPPIPRWCALCRRDRHQASALGAAV